MQSGSSITLIILCMKSFLTKPLVLFCAVFISLLQEMGELVLSDDCDSNMDLRAR